MEALRKWDSLKRANAEAVMVPVFCFNAAAAGLTAEGLQIPSA